MTNADRSWSCSNPGPDELSLWLEPWADEFVIPVRSTVTLVPAGDSQKYVLDEVECTPHRLVVWASTTMVRVLIDDVLQDSASAEIPIPDGLNKATLNLLFGNQPAARLGGEGLAATDRRAWWRKLGRRLGL
ncbi:hypothetical protein FHS96_000298 [Sphingomonas zeicaulis]|uniref:hypothetical protein n=1 Tax=Sphingomonas zeicaulis TaxID=1632740 RepID=UPI003D24E314